MVLGFAGYVITKLSPQSQVTAGENSVSIALPEGLTLKKAIVLIVEDDNATADFKGGCRESFLSSNVRGGEISAKTRLDLIKQLQHRLINAQQNLKLHVIKSDERGIYEIACSQ